MKKRVAILQSSYIPWKGYFDLIGMVDLFIFLDNVQYTKRDWRTRNKIKTPNGTEWLTIPAGRDTNRRICDVQLTDFNWQKKHWEKIRHNYVKTRYYYALAPFLEEVYLNRQWRNLSELNQYLIREICKGWLDIETEIKDSREFQLSERKGEGILQILKQCGATEYLSGPAAKSYIDETFFKDNGIVVEWMDYSDYPEYPQLYPPFDHAVSVIDLIFNTGREAKQYLKYLKIHV